MALTASLGAALRAALADHPDEASPDIAQRVGQLATLADERRTSAPAQKAAAELAKMAKTDRAGDELSPGDRAARTDAVRKAQEAYLREVSPSGSAAYQSARERYANGEL